MFDFNNGSFANTFGGDSGFDAFLASLNTAQDEEIKVEVPRREYVLCSHTLIGKKGYVVRHDPKNPKVWNIKEGIIEELILKEVVDILENAQDKFSGELTVIYGPANLAAFFNGRIVDFMINKQRTDGSPISNTILELYAKVRKLWIEKMDSVVISTHQFQPKALKDASTSWKDTLFKKFANGDIPATYGDTVEAKVEVKEPIMTPEEQIAMLQAEATKALLARDMVTYQAMKEQIATLGGGDSGEEKKASVAESIKEAALEGTGISADQV